MLRISPGNQWTKYVQRWWSQRGWIPTPQGRPTTIWLSTTAGNAATRRRYGDATTARGDAATTHGDAAATQHGRHASTAYGRHATTNGIRWHATAWLRHATTNDRHATRWPGNASARLRKHGTVHAATSKRCAPDQRSSASSSSCCVPLRCNHDENFFDCSTRGWNWRQCCCCSCSCSCSCSPIRGAINEASATPEV